MSIFYHAPSRGFFNTATHSVKNIPADAVEISPALHAQLLAGEYAGKVIQLDKNGQPELVEAQADPDTELVRERAWRDAEIESIKWLRERHRDELEFASKTTLDGEQYQALMTYLQQLRDWPVTKGFPDVAARPARPAWIADQAP
jgi:hypothetical protein